MHRRRAAVCAVVALALLGGPSAGAAPGRACQLVTDPAHDEDVSGEGSGVGAGLAGSLDLLSADVATDARRMTVVIRVRELVSLEPGSPGGTWHTFGFAAERNRFQVDAVRGPDKEVFELHRRAGPFGDGRPATVESFEFVSNIAGVYDEDASEIRLTAPLADLRRFEPIRPGTRLRHFDARAQRRVGNQNDVFFANGAAPSDTAFGGPSSYRAGSPSCVRVGQ